MPDLQQLLDIDANQLVIVAGVVSLAALVMAGLMVRAVLRSRLALIIGIGIATAIVLSALGALLPLVITLGIILIATLFITVRYPALLDLARTLIVNQTSRRQPPVIDNGITYLPDAQRPLVLPPATGVRVVRRTRKARLLDAQQLRDWGF